VIFLIDVVTTNHYGIQYRRDEHHRLLGNLILNRSGIGTFYIPLAFNKELGSGFHTVVYGVAPRPRP
jgi:hypothetical protein